MKHDKLRLDIDRPTLAVLLNAFMQMEAQVRWDMAQVNSGKEDMNYDFYAQYFLLKEKFEFLRNKDMYQEEGFKLKCDISYCFALRGLVSISHPSDEWTNVKMIELSNQLDSFINTIFFNLYPRVQKRLEHGTHNLLH